MRKILYLFRTFFPSWEFFNDVGLEFNVEIQTQGEWQNLITPISRSMKGVLLNPAAASSHSYYNLLQYLHTQMMTEDFDVQSSPVFLIFKNLAEQRAKEDYKMRFIARSPQETYIILETPYFKKGHSL